MRKKDIKIAMVGAVRGTGLLSILAGSRYRSSRLLILCYHGLSLRDEHEWLPALYITPERFRRRLELLKSSRANVLPLGEAVERLRTSSLPPRSVVITFDDGFHDFFQRAVPIAGDFGFPVTLYLTTHYCFYQAPVFNLMLDYLIWKSGLKQVAFPAFGIENTVPCTDYSTRSSVVSRIIGWADQRQLDTVAKDDLAAEVASCLRIDYASLRQSRMLEIMTPEEVGAAARAGMDIELHTHRHRTPRNHDLFVREIHENATHIREFTGSPPSHFCYPSGVYAQEFLPWLQECGVVSATTCERDYAGPRADALLLPRMLDDSLTFDVEFESWVSGLKV